MKPYPPLSYTVWLQMLVLFFQRASSEHVLPTFQNAWYCSGKEFACEDYTKPSNFTYNGVDSCEVDSFSYGKLYDSCDSSYWRQLNLADHAGCYWDYDNVEVYYESADNRRSMPAGFVSSNSDDWYEIMTNNMGNMDFKESYVTTTIYCKDYEDEWHVLDMIVNILEPLYDCPENTRLGYDNVTIELGCTTTPVPCLADVVGRDLDAIDPISQLGHIGLVASSGEVNPNILEVLHKPDNIYLNPLYGAGSFSEKTKYWGEKYGTKGNERLLLNSAQQIIEFGTDQRQYDFSYNWFWMGYYPGGTLDHPYDSKFRCDSFVYYSYMMAGIEIHNPLLYENLPRTFYDDFTCSANPAEYCSILDYQENTTPEIAQEDKKLDVSLLENMTGSTRNITTPALDIFNVLRPIFMTKKAQVEQLPALIKQYHANQDESTKELFVRCICFELKHREPEDIALEVKPLLSDLLWQYKDSLDDNFALAIMNNNLHLFLDQPHCRWLNAYFNTLSETTAHKEASMIEYIDHESDVVSQAHLVTASRLSLYATVSEEKKCEYGRFFQKAYNHDETLSHQDKQLLQLALAELNTHSTNEAAPVHSSCRLN